MGIVRSSKLSFLGIVLGMTTSVLMQTIVATALPNVIVDLGKQELYGWVFSSYMIASIITIPLFSYLSDLYGRKRFYLIGLTLFLLGSIFSGFSQSMIQLLLFRVLQGIGAGAIAPAAIAMISDLFDETNRVKMLGYLTTLQVVASIVGPLVGGFITDIYSWRWTFFINVPVGLMAFLLIHKFYTDLPKNNTKVGGNKNPIPLLELLKEKRIQYSFVGMFLLGSLSFGMITLLPLYGQQMIDDKALVGGAILLIFTLGIGIGGLMSGSLASYYKERQILLLSWTISFLGFISLAIATTIIQMSLIMVFMLVLTVGAVFGVILPVIFASSQQSTDGQYRATIGGLIQISRNVGGAITVPIFTSLLIVNDTNDSYIENFGYVFLLMACLTLLGLLVAFRLKDKEYSKE